VPLLSVPSDRRLPGLHYVAAAPETTSMISRVIAACRTLFM
jgi:hypothetical protein